MEHQLVGVIDGGGAYVLLAAAALFCSASLAHLLAPRLRARRRPFVPLVPTPPVGSSELEVEYLERIYAADPLPERVRFRVGDVVAGAARTGRLLGLRVSVITRNESVEGIPDDLATVLDTLVTNVSRNATDRDVLLRSERRGEFVEVVVGPAVRSRQDTGMGLHISRNLLREQGGDLVVRDTAHGRAFVAIVPAQRTPNGS